VRRGWRSCANFDCSRQLSLAPKSFVFFRHLDRSSSRELDMVDRTNIGAEDTGMEAVSGADAIIASRQTGRDARYDGWPAAAVELVERACARHGGWKRFESVTEISARVAFIGGALPIMKGRGHSYTTPNVVRVEPHSQVTIFVDWPDAGRMGRFERGDLSVTSASGAPQLSRAHRARMPLLRWRPLDALYFFGYALANYWALPFLLATTRFVRASGSAVTVDFPEGFDTHSPRQSFHFDETGLLVRHDYTAHVVGWWAAGSHFSSDYVDADGLLLARNRDVRARLGSWSTPLPVLRGRLDDFSIR
jgi:hypothetical protein